VEGPNPATEDSIINEETKMSKSIKPIFMISELLTFNGCNCCCLW